MTTNLLSLERRYGPYAFGAAVLMAVWYAVVQPQQAAMRADARETREMNQRVADGLNTAALSLNNTANLMLRAIDRLDALARNLERVSDMYRGAHTP